MPRACSTKRPSENLKPHLFQGYTASSSPYYLQLRARHGVWGKTGSTQSTSRYYTKPAGKGPPGHGGFNQEEPLLPSQILLSEPFNTCLP